MCSFRIVCCFFFQAEDGIRDYKVTGVQTCALPICASTRGPVFSCQKTVASSTPARSNRPTSRTGRLGAWVTSAARSEERRVGKECRGRRSPDPRRKKRVQGRQTG